MTPATREAPATTRVALPAPEVPQAPAPAIAPRIPAAPSMAAAWGAAPAAANVSMEVTPEAREASRARTRADADRAMAVGGSRPTADSIFERRPAMNRLSHVGNT